jgi:hypothetical protein
MIKGKSRKLHNSPTEKYLLIFMIMMVALFAVFNFDGSNSLTGATVSENTNIFAGFFEGGNLLTGAAVSGGEVSALALPVINNVILNTTNLILNNTYQNLTANVSTSDADDDNVKVIYNWYKNHISIAGLNMPFEADENQNATDYSGYGHNGAISGATWNASGGFDKNGTYHYDGIDDYISLGTSVASTDFTTEDFSIFAWVNPNNNDAGVIYANRYEISGADSGWFFGLTDNGALVLDINGDDDNAVTESGDGLYSANEWQHVGVVKSGVTGNFYVNGELVASPTLGASGTVIYEGGTTYHDIGKDESGYGGNPTYGIPTSFNGTIDELIIYNKSISAEQVLALYNNKTNLLVSQETDTFEVWNVSATPNDGTSNGTAVFSNGITIITGQDAPIVNTLILNATSSSNYTTQNLTVHWSITDTEVNPLKNITNWYRNGTSITAINMPFESHSHLEYRSTVDYSGFSNNATVLGATWNSTGGYDGWGAYQFNGTDDYLDLGTDVPSTDFTTEDFSIFAWVYPNNNDAGVIYANRYEMSSTDSGWFFGLTDNGALVFDINGDDDNAVTESGDGLYSASTWQHVGLVKVGATGYFYVDGAIVAKKNLGASGTVIYEGGTTYHDIGQDESGFAGGYGIPGKFNGVIDEFVIYNRSLSAEQVEAIYNNRSDLLVSQETRGGDNWTVEVTPNDGNESGATLLSNQILITTQKPTHSDPILNSTFETNLNTENLTITNLSTSDNDLVKNIIDWRKNNVSIAVLNLPFEANEYDEDITTKDYSTSNFNTEIFGALWNFSGGYDSRGAYKFDNTNDYISLASSSNTDFTTENFSIFAWVYPFSTDAGIIYANRYEIGGTDSGWMFGLDSSGTIDFDINGDNDNTVENSATSSYVANKWQHIGVIKQDGIQMYFVDGVNIGNDSVGTSTTIIYEGGTTNKFIGKYSDTANPSHCNNYGIPTCYFDGIIDELTIFNRDLSFAQVLAMFNNRTDTISNEETIAGDIWQGCISPNDGFEEGITKCSNNLTILAAAVANNLPVVNSLLLNTTDLTLNNSDQNITANISSSDSDGESVKVIYNWLQNGTSLAVLNMPFEAVNGTNSSNAYDYSGYGNGGSEVGGVTFNATGGYDGKGAYEFDGSDDYIGLGNGPSIKGTDQFTVCAWFNASSINKMAIVNQRATGTAEGSYYFGINNDPVGKVAFEVYAGGSTGFSFNSNITVNDGNWHFACGVRTNSTDGAIFVEGNLDNTSSGDAKSLDNVDVVIGRWNGGGTYFNGSIDEVTIYNRSLSASQIHALYNNRTDLITSSETTSGQNWTVDATPNDGTEDGAKVRSNQLITTDAVPAVPNNLPVVNTLLLNTTDLTLNGTNQNITANVSTSDGDSDSVKVIYNWLVNGTPLAVLNMPFEAVNGTNSSNAWDYSGNNNNGSVSAATFNSTSGYDGKGAYYFDGSGNDLINLGTPSLFDVTDVISIEVVAKISSTATDVGTFLQKGGTNGGWTEGYRFGYGTTGLLFMQVGNGGASTVSTNDMRDDAWHHYIGQYNGTHTDIYIDGVLNVSEAVAENLEGGTNDVYIGRSYNPSFKYPLNATLDFVRVYNKSLSAEQISALFNNRTDLITSSETTSGQNWTVDATPNDGTEDGAKVRSNQIITLGAAAIPNNLPVVNSLLLNTTDLTLNGTNQNITANVSTSDVDDDSVKVIYNWMINGTPLAVLNMPFEAINGTNSSNAWDYSGYGNNGSETGATFNAISGYDGKGGYDFDGTDDWIGIPTGTNLDGIFAANNSFSLELRFKVGANARGCLFCNYDGSGTSFNLEYHTTNQALRLYLQASGTQDVNSAFNVNDGNWHHVVAVRDIENTKLYLYVDNVLRIDTALTITGDLDDNNGWKIGEDFRSGGAIDFQGSIDEIRVWNRSLSTEQVNSLFNNRTDLITSSETTSGQNWTVDATPNDGTEDGAKVRSNQIITLGAAAIPNNLPVVNSLLLNTTDLTLNGTNQNITANISTSDADSDSVKVIYNWLVNGTPITVLNMPFEAINGTNSSNAWDYSGYGNNGSEVGSIIYNATGGYDGKGAYKFDGSTSYLNLPASSIFDNQQFTISSWVFSDSYDQQGHIFEKGNVNTQYSLFFHDAGAGELYFRTYNSGNTQDNLFDTTANLGITNGAWHHIVATYNSTNKVIYVDGILKKQASYTETMKTGLGTAERIGAYGGGSPAYYYSGTIDEVMVWNRSLSTAQIKALYNNRTDLIVSQETTSGQNWTLDATLNDGNEDGNKVRSNQIITTDAATPDTTAPLIVVISPVNNTKYFNTTIPISFTITDDIALDSCWFDIQNGTNVTLASCTGFSINPGRGNDFRIQLFANDSSNNINATTAWINFSVNNLPVVNSLLLNTTDLTLNNTDQNITANVSTSDGDSDSVKVIYNWLVNGTPLAVLNMPFEAVNGTNSSNAYDYSGYGNGGTESGATFNATGGYDGKGAYRFDGNDYIDLGTYFPEITINFSIVFWMNPESTQAQYADIFGNHENGFTGIVMQQNNLNHNLYEWVYGDGSTFSSTSGQHQFSANVWQHVAAVHNGTDCLLYVNGTLESSGSCNNPMAPNSGRNIWLGQGWQNGASQRFFNGLIDEFMIYNRSLSTTQVKALYNNRTDLITSSETTTGQNWTVDATPNDGTEDGAKVRSNQIIVTDSVAAVGDSTAPTVAFITPTNVSNYTIISYNQTFNVSIFEINNDSVLFSFNNASGTAFNITAINKSGHWSASYNISTLAEGAHTVTVLANDSTNNLNNTEQITFNVDNTAPKVNITNPSSGSSFSIYSSTQRFNASIFELNFVQSVLFSFDNSSGTAFNLTASNSSGYWFVDYNVSTLSNGSHIVTVLANDSAGNYNRTQSITFNVNVTPFVDVDSTSPTVSWITPTNVSNYTIASSNQTFNVSIFEENIISVLFTFDNSSGNDFNVTAVNNSGYWSASYNISNLVEGTNLVTTFAIDSSGNLNNTQQITFILDNTAPKVNITSPNNNDQFNIYNSNQTFNVSIFELNFVQSVLFSFDNSSGTSFNLSGSNSSGYWFVDYNVSTLSNGSHIVTVLANDSSGNYNRTQSVTFNVNVTPFVDVDTTSPTVSWITPTNVSNYTITSSNQTFNVSVLEETIDSVLFSFDNSSSTPFNITAVNNSGYWSASYNVSVLAEGTHTVTVLANDSSGNLNNTVLRTFIVDNTAPLVNITNPGNNDQFNESSSNQTFNVSIKELNFIQNVLFSFDNSSGTSFNITPTNNSGYWISSYNVSKLSNGTHTVTILANDSTGNYNTTQTITFDVDLTEEADSAAPTVTFITPTNVSNYTITSYNQTFNVSIFEINIDSVLFSFDNSSGMVFNITAINKSGHWSASYNISTLAEGTHTVTVLANDSTNNLNNTQSITFIIDNAAPIISLISPINATGDDSNITFNYNVNDTLQVNNCSLIINTLINQTNSSITKNINQNFTLNDLAVGQYNWSINCTDSLGNIGSSKQRMNAVIFSSEFSGRTTDISLVNISNISNYILEQPNFGLINFTDYIDLSMGVNLNAYVNISFNHIELNSSAILGLNKSAKLKLYNLTFSNPRILINGEICPASICTQESYNNGTLTFTVTQFSTFSAQETPTTPASPSTNTGGGSDSVSKEEPLIECSNSNQCPADRYCVENQCLRIFDLKIVQVDSIIPGDSFGFTYFVKGMANISGDVTMDFWLDKKGNEVSSGSDTIFIGDFEEKIEYGTLFVPTDLSLGVYTFYVKLYFDGYEVISHRTVEIKSTKLFPINVILTDLPKITPLVDWEYLVTLTATGSEIIPVLFKRELFKDGEIIDSKEDNLLIQESEIITSTVTGLEDGKYKLLLSTTVNGETITTSRVFIVESSPAPSFVGQAIGKEVLNINTNGLIVLISVIGLILFLLLVLTLRRKKTTQVENKDYLKPLEKWVEQMLIRNKPLEEIKQILDQQGAWAQDHLNKVLVRITTKQTLKQHYGINDKFIKTLNNYVIHHIKLGTSKEDIIEKLVNEGWLKEKIDPFVESHYY